jgi:hypothetical protein
VPGGPTDPDARTRRPESGPGARQVGPWLPESDVTRMRNQRLRTRDGRHGLGRFEQVPYGGVPVSAVAAAPVVIARRRWAGGGGERPGVADRGEPVVLRPPPGHGA